MFLMKIKEAFPHLLKADVSPCLVGPHGIGKTEIVKQFVAETGNFIKIINLGNQDVGDLVGLPDFSLDDEGNKETTTFMIPQWIKDLDNFAIDNPDKYAIIFFDEVNRARRDVLQAIFSLVLEKRIHTHSLASNVRVMFAMNPSDENYVVTDLSDNALLDRMCFLKVTPSKKEFFTYAEKNEVNGDLLGFFKEQEELLDNFDNTFSYDVVKPSRRSVFTADRLIKSGISDELFEQVLPGLFGLKATVAFMQYKKTAKKPIKLDIVLNKFTKVTQKKVKNYVELNRIDLLKDTCDELLEKCKDDEFTLTKKQQTNLETFILMLPKEMVFYVLKPCYLHETVRNIVDNSKEIVDILKAGSALEKEAA